MQSPAVKGDEPSSNVKRGRPASCQKTAPPERPGEASESAVPVQTGRLAAQAADRTVPAGLLAVAPSGRAVIKADLLAMAGAGRRRGRGRAVRLQMLAGVHAFHRRSCGLRRRGSEQGGDGGSASSRSDRLQVPHWTPPLVCKPAIGSVRNLVCFVPKLKPDVSEA